MFYEQCVLVLYCPDWDIDNLVFVVFMSRFNLIFNFVYQHPQLPFWDVAFNLCTGGFSELRS